MHYQYKFLLSIFLHKTHLRVDLFCHLLFVLKFLEIYLKYVKNENEREIEFVGLNKWASFVNEL